MNESLLKNFTDEIQKIRDYLKYIQSVNDIITYPISENDSNETKTLLENLKKQHQKFRTEKRVFEYKAIIISLYGLLEKYLEIWIKEYLDKISDIVPYNELSDKLREKHFSLSMKLIGLVIENRYAKYELLQKEEVLNKLNNCLKEPQNYKFNVETFTIQAGNLTHKRIKEIFEDLAIPLENYLLRNKEVSISGRILHDKIDDLVKRRNEVAHGVEVLDLLDNVVLKEYIDFIEVYNKALFETLHESFIEYEAIRLFRKIEKIYAVYDNSILTFAIENYTIQQGDFLIIQDYQGKFYKTKILNIQKDKTSYNELEIKTEEYIGIKTDLRIKDNWIFYLKK